VNHIADAAQPDMRLTTADPPPLAIDATVPPRTIVPDRHTAASSYLLTLGLVVAANGVAAALFGFVGPGALTLPFLTGVLIAATEYGFGPALMASVLSMVCYDFFFLRPFWSLVIAAPRDLTAFATFAVAALIASRVGTRVRDQAFSARTRAAEASELYQLTRGLAGAGTLDDVARVAAARVAATVARPAAVFLPGAGCPAALRCHPPDARFAAQDRAAAEACLAVGGWPALPSPGGWRFQPIATAGKTLGVIGILPSGRAPAPARAHRLGMIADQVAIAVDRINLVSDLDRERQRDATDRLHAALLAAISHDLRDPLTAILGSAETLDERWESLTTATRTDLVGTMRAESERLALLVHNLLDMARLEGSAFRARLAPTDLSEIVDSTLRRTAALVDGLHLTADVAPGLPPLLLDPTLCEQVLFNLIDNAAKFAPAGSAIRLTAQRHDGRVVLTLCDEGPGFRPEHIASVFDKFFHADAGGRRKGAGLGLTICRGFVAAMGGTIAAANRTDRSGAAIRITFPISGQTT
jgi:two-component system sensor histidine kinase KdpD